MYTKKLTNKKTKKTGVRNLVLQKILDCIPKLVFLAAFKHLENVPLLNDGSVNTSGQTHFYCIKTFQSGLAQPYK